MKPNREAAERIMTVIKAAEPMKDPAQRAMYIEIEMLNLACALIPHSEGYGHAARIHQLTGGKIDD